MLIGSQQYTLFANASTRGTPPIRALWYEFPDESELFAVDKQFLVGRDLLVTPVLIPNMSTVDGLFPGKGKTIWRDWYTHEALPATTGNQTLDAPLGHIPLHVRSGSAILMHAKTGYTIEETLQQPFSLLVSLESDGGAFGDVYLDDGVSDPPGPNRTLTFFVTEGSIEIGSKGNFEVSPRLSNVTVLGTKAPSTVEVSGKAVKGWTYNVTKEELAITGLSVNLNSAETTISWK